MREKYQINTNTHWESGYGNPLTKSKRKMFIKHAANGNNVERIHNKIHFIPLGFLSVYWYAHFCTKLWRFKMITQFIPINNCLLNTLQSCCWDWPFDFDYYSLKFKSILIEYQKIYVQKGLTCMAMETFEVKFSKHWLINQHALQS